MIDANTVLLKNWQISWGKFGQI